MCVNWNELRCASSELQPVATRLPGVRLPLDVSTIIRTMKYISTAWPWLLSKASVGSVNCGFSLSPCGFESRNGVYSYAGLLQTVNSDPGLAGSKPLSKF